MASPSTRGGNTRRSAGRTFTEAGAIYWHQSGRSGYRVVAPFYWHFWRRTSKLQAVFPSMSGATPGQFHRAVNTVNSLLAFGRVYAKDDAIVLGMELATENIDARQVAWACDVMGVLADDLDTKLKEDLGGRTTFPDEPRDEDDAVKV